MPQFRSRHLKRHLAVLVQKLSLSSTLTYLDDGTHHDLQLRKVLFGRPPVLTGVLYFNAVFPEGAGSAAGQESRQ